MRPDASRRRNRHLILVALGNERSRPNPAAGSILRQRLRDLEFKLPLAVQRPILRLLGDGYSPYVAANHSSRSIFIHVPRTGGTSVATALGLPNNHFPISRFHIYDPGACRDYFKFAFVRNPWDRLYSSFCYLREGAQKDFPFADTMWAKKHLQHYAGFEEFVLALRERSVRDTILRYIHFRPQLSWIAMPGHTKPALDFIGRFESLDDGFSALASRFGISAELPRVRASHHADYRQAYSPAMRSVVEDLYRLDIDHLGYGF